MSYYKINQQIHRHLYTHTFSHISTLKNQPPTSFTNQMLSHPQPPSLSISPPTLQQITQCLLQNDSFIQQLRTKLSLQQFSSLQVQSKISQIQKHSSQTCISSSLKHIKKSDLDQIIQEISQLLNDLIEQKLEYELNQIVEENNNVLLQIKENLMLQQRENNIMLQGNNGSNNMNRILQQDNNKAEMSFSDVHRLIAQEKRKFQNINGQYCNDAQLQKSLSSLVDFKFESIQQKVLNVDKRLKTMEDKYETNLKSIWNVLSMTEGAVFDFINKEKEKEKKQAQEDSNNSRKKQQDKKGQATEKKGTFFKLW